MLTEDENAGWAGRGADEHSGHSASACFLSAYASTFRARVIDDQPRRVRGVVSDRFGRPKAEALVVALDRDLRSEQELGRTTTDAKGQYEIWYEPSQFIAGDRRPADLIVRVVDKAGSTLVESPVLFNAGPDEAVLLTLDEDGVEFERLVEDWDPVLADADPTSLSAEELEFISRETGWDVARLGMLVRAHELDLGKSVELVYGLLRVGQPDDLLALAAVPTEILTEAVRRAIAERIISKVSMNDFDVLLGELRRRGVKAIADPTDADPESGIAALLATAVPDPKTRFALAEVWFETRGSEQFWHALADAGADGERMHLAAGLAGTVGAGGPLAQATLERLGDGAPEQVAAWGHEEWRSVVEESGVTVPLDLGDGDPDVATEQFVRSLEAAAADQNRSVALASMLAESPEPAGRAIAELLAERPDLDLAKADIAWLREELPHEQAEAAAAAARVSRISARPSDVVALIEAGVGSAWDLSRLSTEEAVTRLGDRVGPREAAALHRRAQNINASALGLLIRYRRDLERAVPAAVPRPGDDAVPHSWSALFGSLDFCECPGCRSVLSPAAYLVDLLQFLSHRGGSRPGDRNPLDVLRARRPDIERLELTCANTNTVLPTIDLVNELCEARLTGGPAPIRSTLAADELAIQPEHVDEGAYGRLATRVHPWTLPLDRPWEELRVHLARLGVPREELLRVLIRGGEAPSHAAAERLGIAPGEIAHLTARAATPASEYWGLGGDWLTRLVDVRVALATTGLTIEELQELLETWFVRSGGGPTLHSSGPDISLWSLRGLDEARAGRLHRFLRLKRRVGWTIGELDSLLRGLGAADIDTRAIEHLADVDRLRERLGVELGTLAWWWAPLPTDAPASSSELETRSPYNAIFQNPLRAGALDPALELVGSAPRAVGHRVVDHAEGVRAALGITGSELSALLAAAPTATITVAHLSALWREVSLARALSLPIAELVSLRVLMRTDILAEQSPSHVRLLVELVDRTSAWGFTPTELQTLLVAPAPSAADESRVDRVLIDIQRQLAAARNSSGLPLELDTTVLTSLLARVAPVGRAAELAPFFAGPPLAASRAARTALAELLPGLTEPDRNRIVGDTAIAGPVDRLVHLFSRLGVADSGTQQLTIAAANDAATLGRLVSRENVDRLAAFFAETALEDTPANRRLLAELLPDLRPRETAATIVLGPAAAEPVRRLGAVVQRVLVIRAVLPLLASALGSDVGAVSALSDSLRLDPGGPHVLDVLLSDAVAVAAPLTAERLDPVATGPARRAFRRLEKALGVAQRLGLSGPDLPMVCGAGAPSWLDLAGLPVRSGAPGEAAPPPANLEAFGLVADFFTRRRRRQRPGTEWMAVLRTALSTTAMPRLVEETARALSPTPRAVDATAASLNVLVRNLRLDMDAPDPATQADATLAWRDGRAIYLLDSALERLSVAGVTAAVAATWIDPVITPEAARTAVQVLRARFAADQWPEVERPLRDVLRERQRDALVGALTGLNLKIDELSAQLLVDVQIAACQSTSRVEAAVGSVQTFVQRCLLGLEEGVRLDAEAATQWRWMSRYALWAAQRKVFLFPENYLHPELRDDKTPFFVELEQQLEQGELTKDRVEALYERYLEQLDGVARLDVCGCYRERGLDEHGQLAVDRLHVVARTPSTPHRYWYRRLEDGRRWTAWESIDLDIDSEAVVITVSEGRLYLCWPLIREVSDPSPPPTMPVMTVRNVNDPPPKEPPPPGPRAHEPLKHAELELAYSEREAAGWAPRRLAAGVLRFDRIQRSQSEMRQAVHDLTRDQPQRRTELNKQIAVGAFTDLPQEIVYRPLPHPRQIRLVAQHVAGGQNGGSAGRPQDGVQLVIRCYLRQPQYMGDIGIEIGEFRLGGCHGTFEATARNQPRRPALLTPRGFVVTARGGEAASPEPDDRTYLLDVIEPAQPYPPQVDATRPDVELYPTRHDKRLTHSIQGPVQLVLPHGGQFLFNDAFFVEDSTHRFYVYPVPVPPETPDLHAVLGDYSVPPAVAAFALRQSASNAVNAMTAATQDQLSQYFPGIDVDAIAAIGMASTTEAEGPPASLAAHPVLIVTAVADPVAPLAPRTQLFRFESFEHPYTCRFLITLRRGGIDALFRRPQQMPESPPSLDFARQYLPTRFVAEPYPREDVDFGISGAYSMYNWELFVHAPVLIGRRLHRDQRFEEALRWYHRVFDPTSAGPEPTPGRYWNARPLFEAATTDTANELRVALAGEARHGPGLRELVEDWRRHPFAPWRIARLRRTAIPKAVAMAYLDLLLDWGDARFRNYTRESIREAATLYSWAADVLGPRPAELPVEESEVHSYATLAPRLDAFSNAVIAVEELLPGGSGGTTAPADPAALRALGTTFYFCVPPNERLLGYWDRIADRLFKIRHCQDIEGVSRPLALFEPPIDPDLLVRAAAAGVDIARVGAEAPLSPYRFPVVLAKAMELAAEVRALGAALGAALERRDGEELARLRSTHELAMLDAVRSVRERHLEEALAQRRAVQRSQEIAQARQRHYATLLVQGLLPAEQMQLQLLELAEHLHLPQLLLETGAMVTSLIPDFDIGVSGFGGSPKASANWGGSKIAAALSAHARTFAITVSQLSTKAGRTSAGAGYERREQDWKQQQELAGMEVQQLEAQIVAADVRVAIARAELANHDLQREQSEELDRAMRAKFTNAELYAWTASQLSTLHFQAYGLALEAAQRAERAYRYEHPDRTSSFITPGAWDSLHRGLLAGERLQADLRRMESAWLAGNTREYELTKQISLAVHDPLALVRLRAQGEAWFALPEALFDADHPGHYLRRIKAVTLTVPAIVGPYSSVNCSLALTSSEIRVSPQTGRNYARSEGDARFRRYTAAVERIATSRGHGDPGVFELSFRDERYLPFEGAGVVNSQWYLRMDPACNDFDLQTVSDVILEIQYTARDGGESLRESARAAALATRRRERGRRLFSARTDFADSWHEFLHPLTSEPGQTLRVEIDPSRFPYRARQGRINLTRLHLALVLSDAGRAVYPSAGLSIVILGPDGAPISPDPASPEQTTLTLPYTTAEPDAPWPPRPSRVADTPSPITPMPPASVPLNLRAPVTLVIQLPADQLAAHRDLAVDVGGVSRLRPELVEDLLLLVESTLGER